MNERDKAISPLLTALIARSQHSIPLVFSGLISVRAHTKIMPLQQTGQVEIAFEYNRHVGGKFLHGGVRLRFDSTQQYSFTSQATWPTSDNYEDAIRTSIEEVLAEKRAN